LAHLMDYLQRPATYEQDGIADPPTLNGGHQGWADLIGE
jgi:hypothetical protein